MKIIKEFLTIKKTQLENEKVELSKLDRIIYQQTIINNILFEQLKELKKQNEQRKKNKK